MTAQLSERDLTTALDFVREVGAYPNMQAFRDGVSTGLARLVPCDASGYNEVDAVRRETVVMVEPRAAQLDDAEETLARLMDQHPVIQCGLSGDTSPHMISDFLSESEFHRLELYDELYRRMGAEDQLAFSFSGPVLVGLAVNRSRRSFTERDRAILEAVRPHLRQALMRTQARERAAVMVGALERGLEAAGGGVILIDPDGTLAHASPSARLLLERYLDHQLESGALPEPISGWAAAGAGAEPLILHGAQGRLVVRVLDCVGDEPVQVLLLEEQTPRQARPEDLRSLGLTQRQAEVLALVSAGLGNADIAAELFVAEATVAKHLEGVYVRLGVHSRAAAVARALEAARTRG